MTPEAKQKMAMEKELVKGHVLTFILRTAREFALRQTRETIYDTVLPLSPPPPPFFLLSPPSPPLSPPSLPSSKKSKSLISVLLSNLPMVDGELSHFCMKILLYIQSWGCLLSLLFCFLEESRLLIG